MTNSAKTPDARQHGFKFLAALRDTFAIDPRSLALFRMLLAGVLLYDLALRAVDLKTMYGPDGVLPIDSVLAFEHAWGLFLTWSVYNLHASLVFHAALFALAAVFAVALLVGYRTRVATIASWVLLASLHSRAPILVNGGDMLTAALLFWGMFLPLGGCWSLDVRWGRTPRLRRPVCSVASAGAMLQMFLMYVCTGLSKCNEVWLTGQALENTLTFDMFVRPLGRWLLNFPGLLRLLTRLTLFGELIAPLLLISPWGRRYTRAAALTFFVGLHLGIELTMTVALFSWISLAGLSLFLPPEFWRSRFVAGLRLAVRGALPPRWRRRRALRPPSWIAARLQRRAGRRAAQAVCVVMLVFMLVWNASAMGWINYQKQVFLVGIRQYAGDAAPLSGLPRPGAVEQTTFSLNSYLMPFAQAVHFDQRWDMFSAPLDQDYRFVAPARLRNGEEVDVLRDGAAADLQHPEQLAPTEPNVRWMLHYMGLTGSQYAWFAQDTAEYLRRQWNASHDAGRRIESLSVVMVRRLPFADGYERRTLAEIGARPGSWILRHPNGRKSAEGMLRHGMRQGMWTHWRADGVKAGEGPYREGVRHGRWTLWNDPHGEYTEGSGWFENDRLEGRWTYWHANGQKSAEGVYHLGQKEGPWISWYDNGRVNREGTYRSGKEHGHFVFWDKNGNKEFEGEFVDGKEQGPWRIYEANGAIRIVQFRDGERIDFDFSKG